jgi:hypothetical protein
MLYMDSFKKSRSIHRGKGNYINVVLPLPHQNEIDLLQRAFPVDLTPNGIYDVVVCALENLHSRESFVRDCLVMIEHYLEEKPNGYLGMFPNTTNQGLLLEVCLEAFFDDFSKTIKAILGDYKIQLERVISFKVIGGICVELEHEPNSKNPDR